MNQMPEKIYCIPQSITQKNNGLYASYGQSRVEAVYVRSDLHEEKVARLIQLLHWANDMLLDCRSALGECDDCDEETGYVCEGCNDNNAILADIKSALEEKS